MRIGIAQMFITDSLLNNETAIVHLADDAARKGIEILACPEMCLTGYNPQTLGRTGFNFELDSSLARIARAARELNLGIIFGRAEFSGEKLFNTASVFLPDGSNFNYRKMHLTEIENEYFSPGTSPLVFNFKNHKFGMIICRDQNSPELAHSLAAAGAEAMFILAAHYYNPAEARWKLPKNHALPIARAVENHFYVLLANAVGCHLGMVSLGNSLIAGPDGSLVAMGDETSETILACEVKPE